MKVGIITLFDPDTKNYGNFLQTFALNHYLNDIEGIFAETLYVDKYLLAKSLHITYGNLPLAWIYKERKKAEIQKKQHNHIKKRKNYLFFN